MLHGAARWLPPSIVILLVLGSFITTFTMDFVNWDDPQNFLENGNYRGFTWENIAWMLTTDHMGNYIPLTWLTLAWDYELWGMDARGYHATSVLLHCLAAWILYSLILDLFRRAWPAEEVTIRWRVAAAFGALCFAIHPLRVESVAWVTERRDVLSGIFFLLTLWIYVRAPAEGRERVWAMAFAWAIFLFALLSKGTVMALPGVLFVLDVYPLRRWTPGDGSSFKKVALEKVPFVLLSTVFAFITLHTQKSWGSLALAYPLMDRFMQPGFRTYFYFSKTLFPINLSPFYPMESVTSVFQMKYFVPTIGVLATTALLLWKRSCWPALLAVWLCFLGILLPVIGINHAGPQQVADRYSYLPCIPFAILAAAALKVRWGTPVLIVAAGLVLLWGTLTTLQCRFWSDSEALWTRAIDLNEESWVAYHNRAEVREARGDPDGAVRDYRSAIRIVPQIMISNFNLCGTLERKGDKDMAMEGYRYVTQLPAFGARDLIDRGLAHVKLGNLDAASKDFDQAVQASPRNFNTWYNRANTKLERDDVDGALADLEETLKLNPRFAGGLGLRAKARILKGDFLNAIRDCSVALLIDKNHEPAYRQRGTARGTLGDVEGAIADFTRAIEIRPKSAANYTNRAFARSRKKDWDGAIADFSQAIELEPDKPAHVANRASARANKGDLDGAIADFSQVIALDSKSAVGYINRALVRIGKGDREGALKDLRVALEMTPDEGPVRKRIHEEIKKIEK